MKKFSTFALLFAVAAPSVVFAQETQGTTVQMGAPAPLSSKCQFLPNAPDKHEVVKGDTLWDISAKFLKNPWCWPEVWGMNKEDIKNPHWIYPKQIVYFDRKNGRLRLANPLSTENGVTKIQPQIRSVLNDRNAISSIPAHLIEPYLSQPLIIEKEGFENAPRIVAAQKNRVFLGKGDKVYVRGDLKSDTSFHVYRPGVALKDPDTKEIIGYEAVFLGIVNLDKVAKTPDGVDTFIVHNSKQEIGVGDRLVAVPATPIINYVPHSPTQTVNAKIVSIYGGVKVAGQSQIVSLNRGSSHGIDIGTVLEVGRAGAVFPDKTDSKKLIRMPDEVYGNIFVFRVFKNISYGLIMQVSNTVQVGDVVRNPGQ